MLVSVSATDKPNFLHLRVLLKSISRKAGTSTTKTRKEVRSEWKKNDRVNHKVFGDGLVLDVYRENDNDKIDIQFDAVGKKTLLLTYAKLTRI